MSVTQQQVARVPKFNINELKENDIFSENSHFIYLNNTEKPGAYTLFHLESQSKVYLDEGYLTNYLTSANHYDKVVEVGREDKFWTEKQIETAVKKNELPADHTVRVGDLRIPGIRSIWGNITTSTVWTVCYTKQGKNITPKKLKELKAAQIENAKKAFSDGKQTLEDALSSIQNNPIVEFEPGEERKLRGFKVQFSSLNGYYDVIDMDIPDPDNKGANIRKVNINEIKWLVLDGVKYDVAL